MLGALGGGVLAMRLLGVEMPSAWWLVLPAGVWLVYTTDHLLDSLRLKERAHTVRHLFHYRNRAWLIPLAAVVGFASLWLGITRLPEEMVGFGTGLAMFALMHLMVVKVVGERVSPLLFKELGVAFAYACGVLAFPWIAAGSPTASWAIVAFIQFMLLALVNLLLYSFYEYESDARDGHTSFVLAIGRRAGVVVVSLCLLVIVGLALLTLVLPALRPMARIEGPWLLIAAVHAALLLRPDYFGRNLRYRIWGDGIFLVQWIGWFL